MNTRKRVDNDRLMESQLFTKMTEKDICFQSVGRAVGFLWQLPAPSMEGHQVLRVINRRL